MAPTDDEHTPTVIPRHSLGKRILIVEDSDETANALKIGLEDLGFVVAIAHNGPVALQVAKSFRPDICLLDIGLPVMDGYELVKRMRQADPTPDHLQFVAMTGNTLIDKERSLAAGCVDHLRKPVRVHQLARVLEDLFAGALR
jgi:CheY-like chemotaxis protein